MSGAYHPELAAHAQRQLAAVTDTELLADIRAAARLVDELAELWRPQCCSAPPTHEGIPTPDDHHRHP